MDLTAAPPVVAQDSLTHVSVVQVFHVFPSCCYSLLLCDPSHKYGMTCLQTNWRGVSAACYSNSQPHSRRGLGLRD